MNTSSNTPVSGRPEVILIVDDSPENVDLFSDLLSFHGYRTITADSGSRAITIAARGEADLVLMDVVMDGMDGVTAAKIIKSGVSADDFLPVILVTAVHDEELKVKGLGCADAFLSKPTSGAELLAVVRSFLKIRTMARELSRTRDTYKRFYENIPHLYVSVSADGTIENANRAFTEVFRTAREDVAGKKIGSFVSQNDGSVFERFLASVVSGSPLLRQGIYEFTVPTLQKAIKLHVRGTAIPGGSSVNPVVLLMEDVTEKLRLGEEEKLARKQLYRSAHLASIGTLASGVAHELNNPLTAILGFSSALLSRARNNEEFDRAELTSYLEVINSESLRCRDIVEHLHKFARGNSEVLIVPVSLAECVKSAIRLISARAARAEITIVNNLGDGDIVLADANKLEQVFVNLVSNGIDFCRPRDTITVASLPVGQGEKHVTVTVSDNGPGMTSEVLAKAFDPFFTTKEVGKGVGMGLAVSYKIMGELNGRIDIMSEPGAGTTVALEIPRSCQDQHNGE